MSRLVSFVCSPLFLFFFFFNDTATTEIYTLSLHDALPIYDFGVGFGVHHDAGLGADFDEVGDIEVAGDADLAGIARSEEHTSELQSPCNLVCRLLLEKKKSDRGRCEHRLRRDTRRAARFSL